MDNLAEIQVLLCEQLRQKTGFLEVELVSSVVISVMCEAFAGDALYIPNKKASKIHAKLRQKFNGNNHRELAHEFGYSVRNVYTILSNQKPQQLNL